MDLTKMLLYSCFIPLLSSMLRDISTDTQGLGKNRPHESKDIMCTFIATSLPVYSSHVCRQLFPNHESHSLQTTTRQQNAQLIPTNPVSIRIHPPCPQLTVPRGQGREISHPQTKQNKTTKD